MEDQSKEIIKIQKENQEILKDMHKKISEIANYFWWQKFFGILKTALIILILAGGIIYLPSVINKTFEKIMHKIPQELLPLQIQRN